MRHYFGVVWSALKTVLLTLLVPEYIKRMVFITTVYTVLLNLKAEDRDRIDRMNRHYGLIGNSDVLMDIAQRSYMVWDLHDIADLIKEATRVKQHEMSPTLYSEEMRSVIDPEATAAVHLATRIVQSMPIWLRYGTVDSRIQDILWPACEKMNVPHPA